MKTKINICAEEWCDLVFEGKNKSYGAYELRQMSSKRRSLALILSISIFTLGVCAPALIRSMTHETKWGLSEANQMSDLSKLKQEEIKLPIEQPVPEIRRTIRFNPPVISDEVDPQENPPVMDDLIRTTALISNTDQEGIDDGEPQVANLILVGQTVGPVDFVEQMPTFAGGEEARIKFLHENMAYPSIALEMGITGKVILKFVVEKDGRINNVTVLRGIGAGCDEEAIRVVKLMPPWNPGKQNGRAVPVYFVMPIQFAFQN